MADERKWPEWITQRQPSRTHSQPFNENTNRDLTDDRPQSLLPYLTFNHPPPAKYTQTELVTHQDKHVGTTPLPPIAVPKIDTRDQTTQAQAYLRDNETMTAVPPNLISRSTMVSPRPSKHKDQGSSPLHGLTISPVIMPVQYVYDRHQKPPRISPMEVRLRPVFVTDTRKQTTTSWQFLPHEQNDEIVYLRNNVHGDIQRFNMDSTQSHLIQLHKLNAEQLITQPQYRTERGQPRSKARPRPDHNRYY